MRTFTLFFLLALAATLCTAQQDTLTIIHVNDSHSNLVSYGGGHYGGIARAATIIGSWKQTEPNPILIHAGDFMVGSLMFNTYFGVPDLQIMNSLGFDALCLGNHEFDVGPTDLADILATASIDSSFHILCSNALNLSAVPSLEAGVKASAIIHRGGVQVGLIALTTPAANIESNPAPVFLDTNLVQIAMEQVATLKTAGCQVVILISHLGLPLDMQIADYLSGVDVIVGGHSHNPLDAVVYANNIPIVQAGEFFRYVGKLRLVTDGLSTNVLDYTLQEITDAVPAVPDLETTTELLKAGVFQKYSPILGDPYQTIATNDAYKNYAPTTILQPKSPLGNLLTTAMKTSDFVTGIKPEFAIEATGHMASDLYAGAVTPADLFRVYPYGYDTSDGLGFRLASFTLLGGEIAGVLQAMLTFVHPELDEYEYLAQSTGLDFTVDTTGGSLQLGPVIVGEEPLSPGSTYRIVSSDRLAGYLTGLFGITPGNLVVYPVSVFKVFMDHGITRVGVREPMDFQEFRLMQNYPNPFNPNTTIAFELPNPGFVSLKVYDLLGREVRTLVTEQLKAGSYERSFDATDLASGVYFYRLRWGQFVETRKLLLLR